MACPRCGNVEDRVDGYCSVECRNTAEIETERDALKEQLSEYQRLYADRNKVYDSYAEKLAASGYIAIKVEEYNDMKAENAELQKRVTELDAVIKYEQDCRKLYIATNAELRDLIVKLESAWLQDETIQADGSLRPSVSRLVERIAELEAQLANYHTHLTQGTLVWKVPPPDYYLQQFDGEGVA